jgi:hypothetical protein
VVPPLCEWLHQRLEVLNNERLTTSYKMRGQLDYMFHVDQYGKFVRDITHKVARKKKKKKIQP